METTKKKPGPKPGTVKGNGRHMRGAPLSKRVEAHTSYVPICGCWLWTGALNNMGYGMLMVNGKRVLAHRASYEVNVGPIPEGLFALHECDTPSCVNPNHITLGTQTDNMRQASQRGRIRSHGILRPPKVRIAA